MGSAQLRSGCPAQGIASALPWFMHLLRMDPDTFDFEIGVPVTAPISAAGRVKAGQLMRWGPGLRHCVSWAFQYINGTSPTRRRIGVKRLVRRQAR